MATTKITSDNITDGAITSAKLDTNIAVGGTLGVTGATTMTGTLTINNDAPLKLNGTDPLISFQNGAANHWQVGFENTNSDRFVFYENGASAYRMVIDGGNVGIGTASPSAKLNVAGTSPAASSPATYAGTIQINETALSTLEAVGGLEFRGAVFGSGYGSKITGTDTGHLLFGNRSNSATWSERMRIDSSGNVVVGKTAIALASVGGEMRENGFISSSVASSVNGSLTMAVYSTTASAYRFYVGMGGTVFATNTTITSLSDVRVKENIRDLDDGLAKVMQLQPRKFDWKEGKGKDISDDHGFIAQEFEQVFPDMISDWKDPAPEGEEPYKAVNANLIPTLVKAIQEQQALIESLTTRLETLENA